MKIYILEDIITLSLTNKKVNLYAGDYLGPNDEVTVFFNSKTEKIEGYEAYEISHFKYVKGLTSRQKIALVIRYLRHILGFTQLEFAEYLTENGILTSDRKIQRIENGEEKVTIDISLIDDLIILFPEFDWTFINFAEAA